MPRAIAKTQNNLFRIDSEIANSLISNLQKGGPVAIFQQLKDFIVEQIESGRLPPGTRIPSENELARKLSISRMTVQRALRDLSMDGYLNRVQGLGTFVASEKPKYALFAIMPISEEISRRGAVHSAEVHFLGKARADEEVAAALEVETLSEVFHSVIVHKADGRPLQLEDRYVNPFIAPDYLRQDFRKITPSHYLFEVGPLAKAEHIVEAILPDEQMQSLLSIEPLEPCLLLNRRTWIGENVVTKARLIYAGPRFKLAGMFMPPSSHNSIVI